MFRDSETLSIAHFYQKLELATIIYMQQTIFILLLLTASVLQGQEPKFRRLDVSDGLPSSTVYQVFQDSKGYIWFSTEAGVNRFDGTYIETYTMDDDLADNEVFGLFEDSQGRIWARGFNGRFSYFKDGFFYNEDDVDFLKEMYAGSWITSIYEDANGYLYFALSRDGFIILTPDNQVIKKKKKDLEGLVLDFEKKNNRDLDLKLYNIQGFQARSKDRIGILTSFGDMVYSAKENKLVVERIFESDINQLFFVNDKVVLGKSSKNEQLIYQYQYNQNFKPVFHGKEIQASGLIPLSLNKKNQLWLGSLGDGIFLIHDFLTKPTLQEHYLEGKAISSFLEDTEGNYWFSSLGEGVFMLPKNPVLTYSTKQGLGSNDLYAVTGDGRGNIYVGTGDGNLDIIDAKGNIRSLNTLLDKQRGYVRITDIIVDKSRNIWTGTDLGLKVFGKNINIDLKNIKSLSQDNNGNIYFSNNHGVYKIKANESDYSTIWENRSDALSPKDDGTLWIGTNHGLYYYDGKTVNYRGGEDPLFKSRVSDLDQTTNEILCVCTYGNGIILKKGNTIRHLTKNDGLVGNVCRDIFIDKKNNTFWMATNTGISQFRVNEKNLSIHFLVNYSEADNLASNDIRKIYTEGDRVWVATSQGLSYFQKGKGQEITIAPPIYITNIKIWEQDTTIHQLYQLPHYKNNIRIGFTGISFTSNFRIKYMHKMDGVDKDWVYSDIPEAHYPILGPGTYTFRVKAINVDQIESKEEAIIQFVIYPPWWQTSWFRILAFLVISVIAYTVITYIIRNGRQKEELRSKIAESEQMALRAQMNPHFVFNALNSIQHFITMEDEMSANYYLTRFSKLIRQVLENSKQPFISINEEIETLQLYLELEMLRFEGEFTYKIEVDDEIDTYDTQIPTMIIQPFLENAIWHGLMPKEGNSDLLVEFKQDEDFLLCIIHDNGIGRKASAENNKGRTQKHKSTGIANTVKRLALLSNIKDENSLMQITDLEEDGKAMGTTVTLKIPFR
jgi:ligand-binding sensor domain-containing protein